MWIVTVVIRTLGAIARIEHPSPTWVGCHRRFRDQIGRVLTRKSQNYNWGPPWVFVEIVSCFLLK
jgi:hypothetical protein